MIPRAGRNVLFALTALLVAVGSLAPAVALAQADTAAPAEATVEREPNDVAETATPIELDRRVRGNTNGYDTDVFAVEVTRPGARITVDVSKDAVGHRTFQSVSVFAADGHEYAGGGDVGDEETNETVRATARGAGTYYVRLNGDAADVSYELEVSTANVDGVPQEANRENATPLAPGGNVTGTLTADTEAWYAVNATAGDELVANLTANRGYVNDTFVQIHGPDGAFVAGTVGGFDGHVETATVARENGTYYVYLTRNSREPLDYSLTATVRDTRDPTEPNEDRANATPVETGTNVTGELAAGDQDWYAFEATAGQAILPNLTLAGPNRERSIRFDIYGPDGERINAYPNDGIRGDPYTAGVDTIGEPGPAEGAALAETNGTYYVRVSGGEGAENRTGPYALSVATRRLDPFDPNQRPETATRLTPNVTVNATAVAYDPDWFAFEANEGDRVEVSVDSPVQTDMEVAVYTPNGTVTSSDVYYSEVRFSVTASQNGTYRVAIRQNELQPSLRTELPYDLSVDVTAAGAPPGESDADGDNLADAEEAEYGTDPTDTDSDDDGWSDRSEVNRGCDPLDPWSHP